MDAYECRAELFFQRTQRVLDEVGAVVPAGVAVWFNQRQGTWRPWWKQITVVVHGAHETRMTIPDQPRANKIIVAAAQ